MFCFFFVLGQQAQIRGELGDGEEGGFSLRSRFSSFKPMMIPNGGASSEDDVPIAVLRQQRGKAAPVAPVKRRQKRARQESDDEDETSEFDDSDDEPLKAKRQKRSQGGGGANSDSDQEIKWHSLEHHGVLFPPSYVPHGEPLIYKGERLELEAEAEEIATFYASKLGTEHVGKKKFNENFFADFSACLARIKSEHRAKIKSFDKCDFSAIRAHLDQVKAEQKEMKQIM